MAQRSPAPDQSGSFNQDLELSSLANSTHNQLDTQSPQHTINSTHDPQQHVSPNVHMQFMQSQIQRERATCHPTNYHPPSSEAAAIDGSSVNQKIT
ncbi:hypothetical protein PCANC_11243 [Puccinia coronata f. sp. avenae]|jgi:hypothetical protein|uniref:Uncharacterized protein n=1 Tax=Puccinia coronata f. sp. avenae TaxID=200324 RepID=A0A2N5T683_9BASI|nr:hypothetical protein PCANC_11243 [Puccinia coronata f. sp. avenae]